MYNGLQSHERDDQETMAVELIGALAKNPFLWLL